MEIPNGCGSSRTGPGLSLLGPEWTEATTTFPIRSILRRWAGRMKALKSISGSALQAENGRLTSKPLNRTDPGCSFKAMLQKAFISTDETTQTCNDKYMTSAILNFGFQISEFPSPFRTLLYAWSSHFPKHTDRHCSRPKAKEWRSGPDLPPMPCWVCSPGRKERPGIS